MGSSSSELHQDTMKAFVSSLLVATALAAPADVGYVPAPAYAPAPAPYHPAPAYAPAPYHPEKVPPKPFAYEYGGADEYGRHFAKTETQDELGVVKGEYRVELPDGRVQIVSYHADHENGFIADVRYEGEGIPSLPTMPLLLPTLPTTPLLLLMLPTTPLLLLMLPTTPLLLPTLPTMSLLLPTLPTMPLLLPTMVFITLLQLLLTTLLSSLTMLQLMLPLLLVEDLHNNVQTKVNLFI